MLITYNCLAVWVFDLVDCNLESKWDTVKDLPLFWRFNSNNINKKKNTNSITKNKFSTKKKSNDQKRMEWKFLIIN